MMTVKNIADRAEGIKPDEPELDRAVVRRSIEQRSASSRRQAVMPALSNTKHEHFAQALASGKTADEAYQGAGYSPNRHNASRLKTNETIVARVAELTNRGADKAEVSIARILKELARLGFSDLRKAFTPSGALLPPEEWDDDFASAVAAIEVVSRNTGKDAEGNTLVEHVHKIKLWDKNSALEKIAKHLGMFIDRVEHSGSVDLTQRILEGLARARSRKVDV